MTTEVVKLTETYNPINYKVGTGEAQTADDLALEIAKKVNSELTVNDKKDGAYTATADYAVGSSFASITYDKISWSWDFESSQNKYDEADTLLGEMISNSSSIIVAYTASGSNTLEKLSISNNVVTDGNDNKVGCLETGFGISITATQVD
jgi:hypothetical protein